VSALLRYQASILVRSHRWIFPLIAYGLLIAVGASGSTSLAETLDWSAAMLVPVVAFLTRATLTAEPDGARACVAAAAGTVRAQLAALLVALGGGALLGIAGVCYGLLTAQPPATAARAGLFARVAAIAGHPGIVVAGLLTALVCLLVGSAAGALFNPPLLRHPGAAMLATLAAAVFGLASDVSPAGAALRLTSQGQSAGPLAAHWPGSFPLVAAVGLVAVAWWASVFAATRRDTRSHTDA
jgi:hypothetical protein